jgi:uncharacterized protein YecT (DUF1311 family)
MKPLNVTILASVFLATASNPALAETNAAKLSADVASINKCLARETGLQRSENCVGPIANDCQDQPGGSTTIGIVSCLQREEAAWDVILNANYKAAMAALDGSQQAALRKAQRAWIPSRDADCEALWEANKDGTIRGPIAASCRLTATANRALWLADFLEP